MAEDGPEAEPLGRLIPIGRFARLAGLSVPQLRHYDRRGLLPPAAGDRRSGYRYYREAQGEAARVIALLRSIDVPLADIEELLAAPEPARVFRVFAEHRARVERRLSEARAALESIDRIVKEGELMGSSTAGRCSFCHRPASEAPLPLTSGEAGICMACVDLALEVLEIDARGPAKPPPSPEKLPPGWLACAFCGRDRTQVRKLVAGPEIVICDGCLAHVAA